MKKKKILITIESLKTGGDAERITSLIATKLSEYSNVLINLYK